MACVFHWNLVLLLQDWKEWCSVQLATRRAVCLRPHGFPSWYLRAKVPHRVSYNVMWICGPPRVLTLPVWVLPRQGKARKFRFCKTAMQPQLSWQLKIGKNTRWGPFCPLFGILSHHIVQWVRIRPSCHSRLFSSDGCRVQNPME